MIIIFLELKQSIYKKDDSFVSVFPVLKFFGVVAISITFFIFNFLLAKDRTIEQNMSVNSVLLHVVLPILFVLDWFIFYEKNKLKWFYPIGAMIIPAIYVCFIFLRGWILNFEGELIFPYFFFDINKLGVAGVLRWIISLLIIFLIFGYVLYFIDKIMLCIKKNKNI
ncbi:MAG: Pr6Pr family membrane protein [Oscillospiraceae bacterium]|nr:Pr6Pr family membrane protein [Oscillospiraceae bacterium]